MGRQADGETVGTYFHPHNSITRAETATVLSRMLRGNTYRGSDERWYQNHLLALKRAEVLQQDVSPSAKELRENVFAILYKMSLL